MKKFMLIGALLLVGCTTQFARQARPLKQTYVHKYGLEIDKGDWARRGECGQVVTVRKDGVKVTECYDSGQLHGATTYSFPHSEIIAKVEVYERGVLASVTTNFRTGLPLQEICYLPADERHMTAWYEDGTPRSSEIYYSQRLNWGEYYTATNMADSWVIDGEGTRLVRDSAGQVEVEEVIANGQPVKATTYYAASGEPKEISFFCDGRKEGECYTYLEGGLPNTIEQWHHGELDGELVSFSNGQRVGIMPYVKGERHGLEKLLGPEGEVVEEVCWRQGQRHGQDKFFIDGEEKVDWYHHNHIVSRHTYEKLNPRES